MYSGLSALLAFQRQVEVIGNNLANVNTVGFKTQVVQFQDILYQTLQAAAGPTGNGGGSNPVQRGLGVRVSAIDSVFTQGALVATGNSLDVAILGNGLFVVHNGTAELYTRAGLFSVSGNGLLVDTATGFPVQRFGPVGEPQFQVPGDTRIRIPVGTPIAGQATATIQMQGNLDATLAVGASVSAGSLVIFDSLGHPHSLSLEFTKTGANTWSLTGSVPAAEGTVNVNTIAGITFNANGSLAAPPTGTMTVTFTSPTPQPPQVLTLHLGTTGGFDGLTQFGTATTAGAVDQDGFASGTLLDLTVAADGTLLGTFSNGQTLPIAQLALALFRNPGGLNRVGNTQFTASPASGAASLGAPLTGGRGLLQGGTLEAANVDAILELTRLLLAQRHIEANAQTIRTSDEMLQTAADLIT